MTVYRRPSSGVPAGDAIPFQHQGRTHLFFLSSPPGTVDYPERVRTTWQHAASDDLASWEELPPAVQPGGGDAVDADGVWTGSVVEHDGLFHLFYTGHRVGDEHPQTICLATSDDLVHFEKSASNPVLLPPDGLEPVDWRDPFVFWNDGEQCWWMLVAARRADGPHWRRGCIMLATSPDLREWTVEPEPFYEPGTTYCPECPEMWELGGRWYLVYSRFSEFVGTVYRVADSPRGPWRVPEDDALGGRRWYAAKSAPTADGGGRAFFGWVHDRAANGRWCWGGDFAAAREVVADSDGALRVRLPKSVAAMFGRRLDGDEAPARVRLDAVGGAAYEHIALPALPPAWMARVRFEPDSSAVPSECGVMLRTDDQLGGWFVVLDRLRGSVHLSRSPHPLDDFWADLVGRGSEAREVDGALVAEARLPIGTGPHEVVLLVDGDLLEVYVDDRVALAHRLDGAGEHPLGVFVADGSVTVNVDVSVA